MYDHLMKNNNHHFEIDQNIHMRFKNYEENACIYGIWIC